MIILVKRSFIAFWWIFIEKPFISDRIPSTTPGAEPPTIFFGVLHPRNVHNLMGWVQEYEKSNEKVRFPFSCTLCMYSKNENFFDTSPLIHLIHLIQQASNDTTP